jgi:cyanophycin synthetase
MEAHPVTVRSLRVLRGPNLYAYMPVLHAVMDIGPYEEQPSNSFPGFVDRLVAWLPTLHKHECSVGRPGGFIERLQRGTYLGHIVEHITLELQMRMGFDVAFGRARGTGEPGVYNVIIEFKEEVPAVEAFHTALRLVLAAMHDEPFDIPAELDRLAGLADEYRLGPSTGAIVKAARVRKIPVLRITPKGSLVQLGYGVHQKRILASETSYTSAIAVDLCQEKSLTNMMLRQVGVPVPDGDKANSADEAWRIAQEIGMPVVVKPADGNQGKGVSVNLNSEEEIRSAFEIAREYGSAVLVERYLEGHDFRLLVINGKLEAASRRDPAHVIGDGQHTVAELMELLNQDPRRRPGHGGILTRVIANDAVKLTLQQQDMALDSVPEPRQVVRLRRNSNLSTGGTATDVTDEVHPSNARLAELAAQILSLDVAGIDVVCRDISRPLAEQNGGIVEVNAAPGLRMHLHPSEGQPRDVGKPIVDMLYPPGSDARIPVIAVTGTNGKTTVTRLIGHMYDTARWTVGMTCTDGVYIGREQIMHGDCSGPKSALAVLLHPHVEVAVLETARGGILREGLAFDQCQVGVVTNVTSDHLGMGGIHTLDQLAKVKQVVVEAVAKDGAAVLNAQDPLVAQMAAAARGRVVYYALSAKHPVMAAHLAEGEAGVYVEDGMIVVADGKQVIELVDLERVEFTLGGKIDFQVMNALAATAAAWAAGLNPAMIARALTTFVTDEVTVPGRFNRIDFHGIELILDYGHNPAALAALGQAVRALEPRRTLMALTLPGDRRDADCEDSVTATHSYADEYILYEPIDRRGREIGETTDLMRRYLPDNKPSITAADQFDAIRKGLQMLRSGDRFVVIVEEVDAMLDYINARASTCSEDTHCNGPIAIDTVMELPREVEGAYLAVGATPAKARNGKA